VATVAPKERVNILYKPATGDVGEGLELPLKILMVGDFTGQSDDTPVEDRKPINVNNGNLEDVLKAQNVKLTISVPDRLSENAGKDAELPISLSFKSLADFSPEGIVSQVPELKRMLELRSALTALKGPLGNYPKFKKRLQDILGDEKARTALVQELGIQQPKA
jgi:type VI secretion system protein ImpB